jgi:Resolvase, N terminal domain
MSHDNRRNRAILYARVSSAEQVKGYSLDQQIDALRQWALEEGHEVLEEVRDEGVSGAYLERGGLDRVRDLVEEGGSPSSSPRTPTGSPATPATARSSTPSVSGSAPALLPSTIGATTRTRASCCATSKAGWRRVRGSR